jgi:DUSAM domain-containing protein
MSEEVDSEQAHAREKADWEAVRDLEIRLQRGQPLELTSEVSELLRRTAGQVAISSEDAEKGLRSASEAVALLTEIRRRIHEGSERLAEVMMVSVSRAARGDIRGARKVLNSALAAEAVPYHRKVYEALLGSLDKLKQSARS